MALSTLPVTLPPAVRGTGFIPFVAPAAIPQPPAAQFTRILESSLATGAPPPGSGIGQAVRSPDGLSLLDRSYFRDLVAGLDRAGTATGVQRAMPGFTNGLGLETLLGRSGLPGVVQELSQSQAVSLYSSAISLFGSIQSLGADGGDGGPELGSLLDLLA